MTNIPIDTEVRLRLAPEHIAMLDAIANEAGKPRRVTARELLIALLEDDAASHQAGQPAEERIIILRDWKRRR